MRVRRPGSAGAAHCPALVMVLIAAGTLLGAACTPAGTTSKPPVDIRVSVIPGPPAASILVPLDEGTFASQGLNVSIQTVTDTPQAMISLAQGHLDLALISTGSAALNAFNRGADLKIIASGAVLPPGHGSSVKLLVRSQLVDSGVVKSAADLKGRKFALNAKGTNLDYALARALATGNLTPDDVDLVTMPFPEMLAALSTGAIDAGFVAEPTAAQAIAQGIGKVLIDDYAPNMQAVVVAANSRFLEQHREAVTSFLQVYLQAIRRLSDGNLNNDDQALAVLQKYTNTPREVIRLAPAPYWPKDGRLNLESLRDQQAFFIANKSVDYTQPMDMDKLIDYGPLDAALKNLGS